MTFAKFFIWTYLATLVSLDKMYMLQFITKWTACLILVSLIFYLLFFSLFPPNKQNRQGVLQPSHPVCILLTVLLPS